MSEKRMDVLEELNIKSSNCTVPGWASRAGNEIKQMRAMLHEPFESNTTIGRLYEAWNRLPACPLMAVIGDAIQDLQALEAISRYRK